MNWRQKEGEGSDRWCQALNLVVWRFTGMPCGCLPEKPSKVAYCLIRAQWLRPSWEGPRSLGLQRRGSRPGEGWAQNVQWNGRWLCFYAFSPQPFNQLSSMGFRKPMGTGVTEMNRGQFSPFGSSGSACNQVHVSVIGARMDLLGQKVGRLDWLLHEALQGTLENGTSSGQTSPTGMWLDKQKLHCEN